MTEYKNLTDEQLRDTLDFLGSENSTPESIQTPLPQPDQKLADISDDTKLQIEDVYVLDEALYGGPLGKARKTFNRFFGHKKEKVAMETIENLEKPYWDIILNVLKTNKKYMPWKLK
jgi:hypothetical protein